MSEEVVNVDEDEVLAKRRMPKMVFDYFANSTENQVSLRENRTAFSRIRLRPRILVDVSNIDLPTSVSGFQIDMPIMVAPPALHRLAHPDVPVAAWKRWLRLGVETRFEVKAEQGGDAEIKVAKAKLLVGADGVRSPVRKLLLGDEPRDLWMVTWLAIVPSDSIRDLHLQDDDEVRFIQYTATKTGMITCCCGSGVTRWQYRVPDKSGEPSKSFPSDLQSHGQEARKIRLLKQIESAKELQNLMTAMERSESSQIREDRNFDRVPVSRWSDASGRVVLLGDSNTSPQQHMFIN